MKYHIQKKRAKPAYLQLYLQLREDILQGLLPEKAKLPSKRTLADELNISIITVEHAYCLLCDEGYVEARQRSGFYVIFRRDDHFAGSREKEVPLPAAQAPATPTEEAFPFSVLAKTMRAVLSDSGPGILERSPSQGCLVLRQAICSYLAVSRGVEAESAQIVIGAGAEYLYNLIVALLGRECVYAIESPCYRQIEQVYRSADTVYRKLPLGHDGIDSAALWSCRADVLHITPYRSFPSGVTASASKRYEYLRWAQAGKRYIIEDDFESEFSVSKKTEDTLFSHAEADNVIYMNTFSRTLSPSLRVAYLVLPKQLVPVYQQKFGCCACTVASFIQLVLARLLINGDFERHINRVRRRKRKLLAEKK